MDKRLIAFQRLLDIMDELREKCPWDKKQTFDSLKGLTIEEVYELVDAINKNDLSGIEGEIGDLFLHLVFYAKLGEEENAFNVATVLTKVCDKLVERHPHIYGDVEVANEDEVKQNWEKIKLKAGSKSVLGGVPDALPALIQAYRIQEKVKGVGFDWEDVNDVWGKVEEELNEFKAAIKANDAKNMELEFGDVLFSLINLGRFYDLNPENALYKTNAKFKSRFMLMEELILQEKKSISSMSLEEMDLYWDKAKKILA